MAGNKDWTRRHAVAGSDTSTETERELLRPAPSMAGDSTNFCKCCSCKVLLPPRVRSKPRDMQNLLKTRSDGKVHFPTSPYRDQLTSQLLSEEHNALLVADSIDGMKKRARELVDILKTIDLYARFLDAKLKVSSRLQCKFSEITEPETEQQVTSKGPGAQSASIKLNDISVLSFDHSEMPEDIAEILSNYNDKHRDFVRASRNFHGILRHSPKISEGQLKKLELQFEGIRTEYIGSKSAAATHLNDLITSRTDVLQKCVQSLSSVLNQKMDDDRQMFKLLSEIKVENIKLKEDESSVKHHAKLECAHDCEQACTRTHV